MAVTMKDVVRFGKEATRGTAASSLPLHHPFLGSGLVPEVSHPNGELPSSSSWPYVGDAVPLGAIASLQFEPDINVDTIRDIILMASRDAAGDLPSLTIGHSQSGVGDARFLGCVCSQLELNFSRSGGTPDASSVLQGSMSFGCMKPDDASGISAGTQATGHKFQMRHSSVTVNSVTATKITSVRFSITNELSEGEPDDDNMREWLHEALYRSEITLGAYFATEAWRELVVDASEFGATIEFGTGSANETVEAEINLARAPRFTVNKGQPVTFQEITLVPYHDGTNPPIAWDFGTGIGASQLGLS